MGLSLSRAIFFRPLSKQVGLQYIFEIKFKVEIVLMEDFHVQTAWFPFYQLRAIILLKNTRSVIVNLKIF